MKQWMQSLAQKFGNNAGISRLKQWNIVLGVLCAVQAIVIVFISDTLTKPLTAGYVQLDQLSSDAQRERVTVPVLQVLTDVRLAYIAAFALAILAVYHLLMATRLREQYEKGLKASTNRYRWFFLGAAFSILLALIALSIGISDIALLVALIVLGVVTNMTGLFDEQRRAKDGWGMFALGSVTGILPWLIMGASLLTTYLIGASVPLHTLLAFIAVLLVFAKFPVTMLLQRRKLGWCAHYITVEKVFSVIGVVAASLVAWLIYAGSLPL